MELRRSAANDDAEESALACDVIKTCCAYIPTLMLYITSRLGARRPDRFVAQGLSIKRVRSITSTQFGTLA